MKGKIIVVEGTDCSGKETQSKLLEERLHQKRKLIQVIKRLKNKIIILLML